MATPNVIFQGEVVDSSRSSSSPLPADVEKQQHSSCPDDSSKISAFKSLGWLDRLLALWIFLAMAIGIILGNFVPNTGPALQKGQFVGVSVPIGMFLFVVLGRMKIERRCERKLIWV